MSEMNIIQWKPAQAIVAGTTLRDISRPQDNDMALHTGHDVPLILENRRALSEALGITCDQWVFAQQTHSSHMQKVVKADMGKGAFQQVEAIADCDALYTKEAGIAIGVFHADCVPVLLYDPSTNIICAIHSGWQGSVKEITRHCLQQLMEHEGVDPSQVKAYIGPAIALHSFEVHDDVIQKLQAMSFDTTPYIVARSNGTYYVDNKGLNVRMLMDLGVAREHIMVNPNDTFMKNEAFFSYRRDHDCGRHLSFIYRK